MRHFTCISLLYLVLGPLIPAQSQPTETYKLVASDAAIFEGYGTEVAISDDLIAVGTFGGEIFEITYGSVYLLDRETGEERMKIVPPDRLTGDNFGQALAIGGGYLVAGAPNIAQSNYVPGSTYVYDTNTGEQLFKLNAPDGHIADNFGYDVALYDSLALIGAPRNTHSGVDHVGAAYLYDATTGDMLTQFALRDPGADDHFGNAVALSNGYAAISAPNRDSDTANSGSVYIFDTVTGAQLYELHADISIQSDYFGSSVAISEKYVVVGSPVDQYWNGHSGSAYVYDLNTGEQLYRFRATEESIDDEFGYSVSISDHFAIVGAMNDDEDLTEAGAAYIYDLTTGDMVTRLASSDRQKWQSFGGSVAIHNHTAVIGASLEDGVEERTGAVYVFTDIPEPGALALYGVGLALAICKRHLYN